MSRYWDLLETIGEEFHIIQGLNESSTAWKNRVVYSLAARMAYASLWDITEPELDAQEATKGITITYFKKRIIKILESYTALYPELGDFYNQNYDKVSERIYEAFLSTGNIYHMNYHVEPSMQSIAKTKRICLTRGIPIEHAQYVSGAGSYTVSPLSVKEYAVTEMFQLQQVPLNTVWSETIENRSWMEFQPENSSVTYLRTQPPFYKGYWVDKCEKSEDVSLLRVQTAGSYLYYLYRVADGNIEVSQLPDWMTTNGTYLTVANACIANKDTLPPTKYCVDGEIVKIQLQYLLPPAELNLLKLYSWPDSDTFESTTDFFHVMDATVFIELKSILEQEGYKFIEV